MSPKGETHIADLELKAGQLTIEVDWMKNPEKSSAPNDFVCVVDSFLAESALEKPK